MCYGAEEFSGNGSLVVTKPVVVSDLPEGETVQVFSYAKNNDTYVVNRNGIWFIDNSDNTLNPSFTFKTVAELVANPDVTELSTYAAPVAGDDDDSDEDVDEPFTNMGSEEFTQIVDDIIAEAGITDHGDATLTKLGIGPVMRKLAQVIETLNLGLTREARATTPPAQIGAAIAEIIFTAAKSGHHNTTLQTIVKDARVEASNIVGATPSYDPIAEMEKFLRSLSSAPSSYGN